MSVYHSTWLEAGSRQRDRGRFCPERRKVELKEQGSWRENRDNRFGQRVWEEVRGRRGR